MPAFDSRKDYTSYKLNEYEIIRYCSIQQLIKKFVLYILKFWERKGWGWYIKGMKENGKKYLYNFSILRDD